MFIKSLKLKAFIAFLIGCIFVFFTSVAGTRLVDSRQDALLKNEIFLFINTIFPSYKSHNTPTIENFADKFNYQIAKQIPDRSEMIYQEDREGVQIQVFRSKQYIGVMFYCKDNSLIAIKDYHLPFLERHGIQLLLLPIFIILLVFIITCFSVLHAIQKLRIGVERAIKGEDDLLVQSRRKDEIGELIETFSQTKETITKVLRGRELILRSLGHELKTPLAKMKLSLGLKESKTQDDRKMLRYVEELQKISDNILEFERVNSGNVVLEQNNFLSETLIFEALRSFEEEQDNITCEIKQNHLIKSDFRLLVVVVKNLIDNALKYSSDDKISITAKAHFLTIKNKGQPLKYDFSYYLEPFYRDDKHQSILGHGLGLSIINEILKILKLSLRYKYQEGHHHFTIDLRQRD